MDKNVLIYYVENRLRSVTRNIMAYSKDKKQIHLHHLRVDIKKIRAIFSFIEKLSEKKCDATTLKPLFIEAGKIREIQINIFILNATVNSPKKLITQLRKKEKVLVQRFIQNESKYTILINNFLKNKFLPTKLESKIRIKRYFKKEIQKAKKIFALKERESMHRYRKKIKRLTYIFNALPDKIQNDIKWNKAEIKKLEKKLGNWHDIYCAVKLLSKGANQMKTSEYFLKTKQKEEKQFNALFEKQ